METVKKIYSDLKQYGQNFEFRHKLIDISIAVKVMIYPAYMLVNKTNLDIFYGADSMVQAKTNDFLMGPKKDSAKLAIRASGFKESKAVDISTIGLSGEIQLDSEDSKSQD